MAISKCPEKYLHRYKTISSVPFTLIAEDYYYVFNNSMSFDIDYIEINKKKYSKAYITYNHLTTKLRDPQKSIIMVLTIYYTNKQHSTHFQPAYYIQGDGNIVLYSKKYPGFRLILQRVQSGDVSTPVQIAAMMIDNKKAYTPTTTPPPTPVPTPTPTIMSNYKNFDSNTLKKTNSYNPVLVGEYTNAIDADLILDTHDKLQSVITAYKTKCEKQSQHDYILPKTIRTDDKMSDVINKLTSNPDIINNLIKTDSTFTCCDPVDMEELVLKTSIVPCSNLIPDKYKKFGEKYDPNVDKKYHEIKPPELHKHRVHDKFSILIIVLLFLLIFIIILNII